MTLGPGQYDELCTFVRLAAHAQGCMLIIINGEHGSGFSVQSTLLPARVISLLREMAAQIEKGETYGHVD